MAWDNRPATAGRARCAPYLEGELALLSPVRVLVAFDRVGFDAYLRARAARGEPPPRPRPAFAHGAEITLAPGLTLLPCYHPSRQNTQTGRLTWPMFDTIFATARRLLPSPTSACCPGGRQGASA